jgi:hypothetical protein
MVASLSATRAEGMAVTAPTRAVRSVMLSFIMIKEEGCIV